MVGPCAPLRVSLHPGVPAALLRIVLVMAAGLATACGGGAAGSLSDLDRLEDLKVQFNRDSGKPRIVLLLSPT